MIFQRIVLALSVVVALVAFARGYADPGACSGDCWAHDPALIRRSLDGVYFRFNTGSEIGIWKSSSLIGPWVYQGKVLPGGSSINLAGKTDCWAPDVHLVGSSYILYYAVSTFGSQESAIGYATSPTMEAGSWTDHGSTGVTSSRGKAYNAIDPNLVQAGDFYYMNFGSFWTDIYQAPMNADGTAPSSSAYQIAYNSSGSHAVEGSFMYYLSGYYYLFFSSGICCGYQTSKPSAGDEYKIHVCRSANVSGPFVDQDGLSCTAGGGTVVLESHGYVYGPGGQGVMDDPTYGTVLYYHYANTGLGLADSKYQFGWNTLSWSSGWPSM